MAPGYIIVIIRTVIVTVSPYIGTDSTVPGTSTFTGSFASFSQ